jgi:hypothetical protein
MAGGILFVGKIFFLHAMEDTRGEQINYTGSGLLKSKEVF